MQGEIFRRQQDRYLDKVSPRDATTTALAFGAGWDGLRRELMRLSRHWENFGNMTDAERAATVRDALRMVREGEWECRQPDHGGEGPVD